MSRTPRAFVIAGSSAHAEDWLHSHATRIRGLTVVEITTELDATGIRLHRGDRIVYVPGWSANPDARAIRLLLDTTTLDDEEGPEQ